MSNPGLDYSKLAEVIRLIIREEVPGLIKQHTSHLPTKNEFYASQDELMTELKALRQTTELSSGQISNHEIRLDHLESRLNSNP